MSTKEEELSRWVLKACADHVCGVLQDLFELSPGKVSGMWTLLHLLSVITHWMPNI